MLDLKFRSQNVGFTLVELMVVVAIIGIILGTGTVAFNNYSKQVADEYGKILLEEIIANQKVFYIHNRKYASSLSQLGYSSDRVLSRENLFEASISACPGQPLTSCIQAVASPLTTQSTGTTFVRDSRGNKSPADKW